MGETEMSWTDLPEGVDRRIRSLVRDGVASHNKRARRARIMVASIIAGSLAVGGTAGSALVLAGQTERSRTAYCFSEASLESTPEQMSLPLELVAISGADSEARATKRAAMTEDLCGALWRAGVFGRSADPELAICEQNDGVLAALPKFDGVTDERLCEDVGLLPLIR
jgi:hypothetical protein